MSNFVDPFLFQSDKMKTQRYNFDEVIDRHGTDAVKQDKLKDYFGREDIIAAWVADMDFATPSFVIDAIRERLEHPVLGYTCEPSDYRPAIIDWQRKLHGWEIQPEWLSYIPGIVKGIGMAINAFTNPGDPVVIMPPVYHPFRITTELNGRKVVNVPLLSDEEGRFFMDFEALEALDVNGGLMIISNPHNPGGRNWSREELARLARICKSKGITVISDEIHADMCLWGNTHVPFAASCDEAAEISVTFGAPSKTFNIPGVVSSFSVVPDAKLREKFYGWLEASELASAPLFSYVATIAAYRKGDEWRREMLDYVEENIRYTEDYCRKFIPEIRPLRPGASYLVWLDCRGLGLDHDRLQDFFINEARVALNDGEMFGQGGEGHMRFNMGEPRSVIKEILDRIREAVEKLRLQNK